MVRRARAAFEYRFEVRGVRCRLDQSGGGGASGKGGNSIHGLTILPVGYQGGRWLVRDIDPGRQIEKGGCKPHR